MAPGQDHHDDRRIHRCQRGRKRAYEALEFACDALQVRRLNLVGKRLRLQQCGVNLILSLKLCWRLSNPFGLQVLCGASREGTSSKEPISEFLPSLDQPV